MTMAEFLRAMRVQFGEARRDLQDDERKMFLASFRVVLAGASKEVLDGAWVHLLKTHGDPGWPTVAACHAAVEAAKKDLRSRGVGLTPIADFDGWFSELLASIRKAETRGEIQSLVDEIKPYVDAKWCWPSRLAEANAVAAARIGELAALPEPAHCEASA